MKGETTEGGITEGGITEDGITEDGITEGGATEGGITEGGVTEDGITEGGTTEGGTTEGGVTEDGITEGGTTEVVAKNKKKSIKQTTGSSRNKTKVAKTKLPQIKSEEKPKPRPKYKAPLPSELPPYRFTALQKKKPKEDPKSENPQKKKYVVPKLANLQNKWVPYPHPTMSYSNKYKTGEAGKPGLEYIVPKYLQNKHPTPVIEPKSSLPRVPVQLQAYAHLDKKGVLSVHVDGDSKNVADGTRLQVTLVHGFVSTKGPKSSCAKANDDQITMESFDNSLSLGDAKLIPHPEEYLSKNSLDLLQTLGRHPKLNTTMTSGNFLQYQRIYHK